MAIVTVDRAKLRQRIVDAEAKAKAAHDERVKKFKAEQVKYTKARKEWKDALLKRLREITAEVKATDPEEVRDDYYGDYRVRLGHRSPDAPGDPGEYSDESFKDDLAFVDMLVGDEVKVEPGKSRLARYL